MDPFYMAMSGPVAVAVYIYFQNPRSPRYESMLGGALAGAITVYISLGILDLPVLAAGLLGAAATWGAAFMLSGAN